MFEGGVNKALCQTEQVVHKLCNFFAAFTRVMAIASLLVVSTVCFWVCLCLLGFLVQVLATCPGFTLPSVPCMDNELLSTEVIYYHLLLSLRLRCPLQYVPVLCNVAV